jgi:hypothetical protein
VKTAIRSLVLAIAVAVSASSADAAPPRFSGNNTVPVRASTFYDEARYGEFLPHSDPRGAFSTYGVAYARPYYRNNPPVNYPTPTYAPRGGFIGMYNGGIFGSRREGR